MNELNFSDNIVKLRHKKKITQEKSTPEVVCPFLSYPQSVTYLIIHSGICQPIPDILSVFRSINPIKITTGKIIAAPSPDFKLFPVESATMPTTVGPDEHPISPANAKSAYITVPPAGSFTAATLNVPGQNIPTEKPQTAQPINPNRGISASIASA